MLKHYTQNVVKKLFPDAFLKNQNRVYLWINILIVLYTLFLLCGNLRAIEI